MCASRKSYCTLGYFHHAVAEYYLRLSRATPEPVWRHAAIAYVAPFGIYVGIMALEHALSIPAQIGYPVRVVLTLVALLLSSRGAVGFRPVSPLTSAGIGLLVFAIWIAPDALIGYRHLWPFDNPITGKAAASLPPMLQRELWFLVLRASGSALLVPVIEELFWRGWLMRWLIDRNFQKVPLGAYVPSAFWVTAALFASEHGPYWEVGLAAGVIYNWWIIRQKNLADCILAHAVTNAALACYVIFTGNWQYWL